VSMRIASPISHAEPAAHLLQVTAKRDQIPPACEHCDQFRLLAAKLRGKAKRKSLELDRIFRDKAELLGTAVHDLRLPVANIQIYSELMAEGINGTAGPELIEWVNSIHASSTFALRLLDETLDLAIAESGTAQLHAVPAILAPIVAKSVSMSFPLAARKQMGLTLIQEGEPQPVLLDAIKMCKVFNNLIENAIKYSQPGARIEVRILREEDSVRVSVKDDGPGIGPADLKTLFTPFQRTRARALSEEPSAGLGLSIAKRIVNLHGGRIWLNTETGKGTTFYVSLPTGIPSAAKKS